MASGTSIPITDQPDQGSTEISYTSGDAANNMKFVNDGRTILLVKVGATQTTITVEGIPDEAGRDGNASQTVTNAEVVFGPFHERWFNVRDGTSEVEVTLDQDTDVQVAALRLQI